MTDVFAGFAEHDRGKLIMACGTGKTFTSLKIAERLQSERAEAGQGDHTTVLFLVPSIALLSQTLREWSYEAEAPLRAFAVCSDTKVGKQKAQGDDKDMSTHDLALPATTDPDRLVAQMASVEATPGLTVVFSTYQSIATVWPLRRRAWRGSTSSCATRPTAPPASPCPVTTSPRSSASMTTASSAQTTACT
ncbi:DEAD/DEAH box helicase family protein [Streptomyces sp. INA 01156]